MEKKQYPLFDALLMNYRAYIIMDDHCPNLFLSIFLYAACSAIAPYVTIYTSARIISELAGERQAQQLWFWVMVTLFSSAVLALLNSVLFHWKTCKQYPQNMYRNKVFSDKAMDMDFSALDRQSTIDLRRRIDLHHQFRSWGLLRVVEYYETLLNALISILGALVLSASLFLEKVPSTAGRWTILNHPLFAVLIAVILLFLCLLAPKCSTKSENIMVSFTKVYEKSDRFFNYLANFPDERERSLDIRMYRQEKSFDHYWKKMNTYGDYRDKDSLAAAHLGPMGLWKAAGSAVSMLSLAVIYLFVCMKAWAGAFNVGQVTQYVAAITVLSQSIAKLLAVFGELKNNAVFLEDTFEYLDIKNEMYRGSLTTEKRSDRQYDVEFRDVSFCYPGSDQYALRHVNMKFEVEQKLAVVGMNGSGKTTFIKLLCRLYDPTEGQILLNGIDIRKYRYDDYINLFSVVFQDFKLLSFPLAENVAVSRNYDKERVRSCLEKAGFGDRLDTLPDGEETFLYRDYNVNGIEISGGEAQKIAIARALYKDSPFIILDEPTAALDPIAEAEIYSKFNDIVGDKTAIYISHRLSSCRFCDNILVFDHGSVVQQGNHDSLLAEEDGKYHELWHAQAQYYEEAKEDVVS